MRSIRKECDPMAVNESAENYLETILVLSKTHPVVRSVDIAEELGYSKPSVSRAVGIMKKDGFIKVCVVQNSRISLIK